MEKASCKSCYFYQEHSGGYGWCVRNPPSGDQFAWTREDRFCGEYINKDGNETDFSHAKANDKKMIESITATK